LLKCAKAGFPRPPKKAPWPFPARKNPGRKIPDQNPLPNSGPKKTGNPAQNIFKFIVKSTNFCFLKLYHYWIPIQHPDPKNYRDDTPSIANWFKILE
jgi:hypothetical protein